MQMFVSAPLLTDLEQFRIAHLNSDWPADYAGDVARGTSDHDPNVATFVINDPPTVLAGGPYTDVEGASVQVCATGSDPEGGPLAYAWDLDNNGTFETPGRCATFAAAAGSAPATLTIKVKATDSGGLTATATALVYVIWAWSGPFVPIDPVPTLNALKAGASVPVRFSIAGDQGLAILASGYPKSQQIVCGSNDPLDQVEETLTAGSSGLRYDAATGQYVYVWKTEKSWAGTCRALTLKLTDGTSHEAYFKFTK
jgi:hypothetical protein